MLQYHVHRSGRPAPRPALLAHLRREMDETFRTPTAAGSFPAVNVSEDDTAFTISAELPGIPSEEIEVSLEGSTLTLSGERKLEEVPDGARVHRLERRTGAFQRVFELPTEVNGDGVEAIHEHGVLRLRLPKVPEEQPRQIPVVSQ